MSELTFSAHHLLRVRSPPRSEKCVEHWTIARKKLKFPGMTKPTLLILAAGMGSRYGGLKQIDPVGPAGETIIDYSIYDALRAGFGKLVFVIRKDIEQQFREIVGARFEKRVAVEYVFQELDKLPPGFSLPAGRTKPWGTTHAILMAEKVIKEPFAAINADDFYGQQAYKLLAQAPDFRFARLRDGRFHFEKHAVRFRQRRARGFPHGCE